MYHELSVTDFLFKNKENLKMTERLEVITRIISKAAYTINGSLILSGIFDILNKNAAAFGVILGFLTFLTNLYFQYLNHKSISSKKDESST